MASMKASSDAACSTEVVSCSMVFEDAIGKFAGEGRAIRAEVRTSSVASLYSPIPADGDDDTNSDLLDSSSAPGSTPRTRGTTC